MLVVRLSVVRILALVVLTGCAATPRIAYRGVDRAMAGQPGEAEGTCPAAVHVRVVDTAGAPVAGAKVDASVRLRMSAPSMVPIDRDYETAAVVTDAHGDAHTCRPERLAEYDDYFTHRSDARIEAWLDKRTGGISSPYEEPIVLRP